MKTSTMLRGAANAVERDQEFYLCCALSSLYGDASVLVRKEIGRRLEGCVSLYGWLLLKAGIDGSPEQVRAHRVAWARLMADEYEAKGD